MLGLGAGIDYALLLAARQQEELRAGRSPLEAAQRANATAGHSALTAAGIVLVSISGLLVTGIPFVGRAGVAAGLVVLACALVCVVLLPARFARAGRKLLPRRERAEGGAVAPARTPRAPWATKRPGLALAAAGAVTARARRARARPAAGPARRPQPHDGHHAAPGLRPPGGGLRPRRQRPARRRRLTARRHRGASRSRSSPSGSRPTARSPTSPPRSSTRRATPP